LPLNTPLGVGKSTVRDIDRLELFFSGMAVGIGQHDLPFTNFCHERVLAAEPKNLLKSRLLSTHGSDKTA